MKPKVNIFSRIVINNFKKDIFKNILVSIALLISSFSMLTMLGFAINSKVLVNNEEQLFFDKNVLEISKHEQIVINNSPLNINRKKRPSRSEVESVVKFLPGTTYDVCLNPLFNQGDLKIFEEKVNPIPVIVSDFNKVDKSNTLQNRPILGKPNEVFINNCFAKNLENTFNIDNWSDKYFDFSFKIAIETYDENNELFRDEINLEIPLKIIGVVKEGEFLKQERIFYDYKVWKRYFQNIKLENKSNIEERYVSLYSYLLEVSDNDPLSNYSYNLFFSNYETVKKAIEMNEKLKNSNSYIQFSSNNIQTISLMNNIVFFINGTLGVFLVICVVATLIILSITSFTKIISKKVQIALLITLNAPKRTIFNIFFFESFLVNCSALLSVPLIIFLEPKLNALLFKYTGLNNAIKLPLKSYLGIPYFFPLILLLTTFLISYIVIFTIFRIINKKPLIRSLTSE